MRFFALLSACTVVLAAQSPVPVKAPIQRVRLHPDEAWVTRVGRHALGGAGTFRLQVAGLPAGLGLEDLRVSARGPQGLRLGDVGLRAAVRQVTETPEYQSLKAEREGLQDRMDALEAEEGALDTEEAFLKKLQAAHQTELAGRLSYTLPSATAVTDLSKGIQERMTTVLTRQRKRKRELDRAQEEAARLDARLAQLTGGRHASPVTATVEVTAARPGEVELELTYRVRGAAWAPAYEARLSADGHALELALYASVRQRSGEAWDGVQLEITNARASRSLVLARYQEAQSVDWQETMPVTNLRKAALEMPVAVQNVVGSADLAPGIAAPSRMEDAEVTEARAQEEAPGLATTWALEGSKEVPADGEPYRFRLLSREMAPDMTLVATPRLDPTVHRVASFALPAGLPIFPGAPVVHFAGTQRVGASSLVLPPPGQPLQLGFGPYRGARVALQTLEARKEVVGTFTKESQWTLSEQIEVSNDTAAPLAVVVLDRELHAASDRVKVTLLPGGTPSEASRTPGVRQWRVSVPPRETGKIQLGLQIRAPQSGHVTGLGGLKLPQ